MKNVLILEICMNMNMKGSKCDVKLCKHNKITNLRINHQTDYCLLHSKGSPWKFFLLLFVKIGI